MCVCSSRFCTNLLAFLLSVMVEVGPCPHHVCGVPSLQNHESKSAPFHISRPLCYFVTAANNGPRQHQKEWMSEGRTVGWGSRAQSCLVLVSRTKVRCLSGHVHSSGSVGKAGRVLNLSWPCPEAPIFFLISPLLIHIVFVLWFIFNFLLLFYFMCTGALLVCMSVYHVSV